MTFLSGRWLLGNPSYTGVPNIVALRPRRASSFFHVAYRQVVWTAMLVILTARGLRQRAAGPCETEPKVVSHAAASGLGRALDGPIAINRFRAGGLRGGGGRRWRRLWRVRPFLNGI